ncbi:hypothetical protein [Desulfofustis glycolicus]|uniref:hypothetical protein n=1 Tax=Desulfofustis glycolicus TaxID=51195 RepID=UPI00093409CC|nr:hypothetical protein [Desulfofustis glycolicus]
MLGTISSRVPRTTGLIDTGPGSGRVGCRIWPARSVPISSTISHNTGLRIVDLPLLVLSCICLKYMSSCQQP